MGMKPKLDAKLAAIVATMKDQTSDLMDTAGVDAASEVQFIDPDAQSATEEAETTTTTTKKSKKIRVDIKKLTQFMSQSKLRKFKQKEKEEKKRVKQGKKKKKTFKW